MELSQQDTLRLNVLLANDVQAVRIDESAMTVHGLYSNGEKSIHLNPVGRDEAYLKRVRELLSSHVLGSPGGYPVYLKRWTRMGQAKGDSLERLLMLGEPEAVVAVVHSESLTGELARRAWWSMPSSENARRMLQRECVARGPLARELAEFLLEYLPFETDPQAIIESIQLILRSGTIGEADRNRIWSQARHKNFYYLGFLLAIPDDLPEPLAPHPHHRRLVKDLDALVREQNPFAGQLCRVLSGTGQAYLNTAAAVLRKPTNQDVVVIIINALEDYFSSARCTRVAGRDVDEMIDRCGECCTLEQSETPREISAVLRVAPYMQKECGAILALSQLGEQLVNPILSRTDAIGTVLRRRMDPVISPVLHQIAVLLHSSPENP